MVGGRTVVVEDPACHIVAFLLGLGDARLLGGVGTKEVMKGIAARDMLAEHVRGGELGQQSPGLTWFYSGEAGSRGHADVWAGVYSEQPEHPGGRRGQALVGPGEDRPSAGGLLPGVQRVKPGLFPGHLLGEDRDRKIGRGCGPCGSDRERQRQPRAQSDEPHGGIRLRSEPLAPEPGRQQPGGGLRVEQVQGNLGRAVGGDEPGERGPAGDQDQATRAGRQQRPYLGGLAGVVEYEHHPPSRDQAPVQACLAALGDGHPLRRYAERVKETSDRLGGRGRRRCRIKAAEVHIELAVGEPVGGLVCPVHRQGCLPDPAAPGQRRDHHSAAAIGDLI